MIKNLLFLFVLLSLLPVNVAAQSLGDVAKKERKRRESNKENKAEVRTFSETEIFGETEPAEDDSEGDEDGAGAQQPDETDADSDARPDSQNSAGPSPDGADEESTRALESDASDRRRQEAEWRARFADARSNLDEAKQVRAGLDELYLTQGEQYVDSDGNVVIESLEHLRRLIRDADQSVANAEQRLAALEERARRENIPPGWRR